MSLRPAPAVLVAAVFSACAHADSTLVYEASRPEGKAWELRIFTAEFEARVEGGPVQPAGYLLFDGTARLVFYSVDDAGKRYWLLPQPVGSAAGGEAGESRPPLSAVDPVRTRPAPLARPEFAPTPGQEDVAGVRCRIVSEVRDGKPFAEHCMATASALGISERDVRTLSRLFNTGTGYAMGWGLAGTQDERFISVRTRDAAGRQVVELRSVDNKPLPIGRVRIEPDYLKVEPPGGAKPGP
jgi:hypothetical protein